MTDVVKCDFCTKPMVGYTNYQIHLYCADHQQIAEEKTREILDLMNKAEQNFRQKKEVRP